MTYFTEYDASMNGDCEEVTRHLHQVEILKQRWNNMKTVSCKRLKVFLCYTGSRKNFWKTAKNLSKYYRNAVYPDYCHSSNRNQKFSNSLGSCFYQPRMSRLWWHHVTRDKIVTDLHWHFNKCKSGIKKIIILFWLSESKHWIANYLKTF